MIRLPYKFSGQLRTTFDAIERALGRLQPVSNPLVEVQQTSLGVSIRPGAARRGGGRYQVVEAAVSGNETDDTIDCQRLDTLETITVYKPRHLRASTWNPGWNPDPGGPGIIQEGPPGDFYAAVEYAVRYRTAQRRYRIVHWSGYLADENIPEFGIDAPDVNIDFKVIHESVWPPYVVGGTSGSNGSTSNDISFLKCEWINNRWEDRNDAGRIWADENLLRGVAGINDLQYTYGGLQQWDDQHDGSGSVLNLGT